MRNILSASRGEGNTKRAAVTVRAARSSLLLAFLRYSGSASFMSSDSRCLASRLNFEVKSSRNLLNTVAAKKSDTVIREETVAHQDLKIY